MPSGDRPFTGTEDDEIEPAAFTLRGASRYCGLSQQLLRLLIREGRIKAVDASTGTGQRPLYLVTREELDRFLRGDAA